MEMMMTYAESPEPGQCPAGSEDRIMHASLTIDGRASWRPIPRLASPIRP